MTEHSMTQFPPILLYNNPLMKIILSYLPESAQYNLISKQLYFIKLYCLFSNISDKDSASKAWDAIYKYSFSQLLKRPIGLTQKQLGGGNTTLLEFFKTSINNANNNYLPINLFPKIKALEISIDIQLNQKISDEDLNYLKNLSCLSGYQIECAAGLLPLLNAEARISFCNLNRKYYGETWLDKTFSLFLRVISDYELDFDKMYSNSLINFKYNSLSVLIDRHKNSFTKAHLGRIPFAYAQQLAELIKVRGDLFDEAYIQSLLKKPLSIGNDYATQHTDAEPMHSWLELGILIEHMPNPESILCQLSLSVLITTPIMSKYHAHAWSGLLNSIATRSPDFFNTLDLYQLLQRFDAYPQQMTPFLIKLTDVCNALFTQRVIQKLITLLSHQSETCRINICIILENYYLFARANKTELVVFQDVKQILNLFATNKPSQLVVAVNLLISMVGYFDIFFDHDVENNLSSQEQHLRTYSCLIFFLGLIKNKLYSLLTKEHINMFLKIMDELEKSIFNNNINCIERMHCAIIMPIFNLFFLNRPDLFDSELVSDLMNPLLNMLPISILQFEVIHWLTLNKPILFLPYFSKIHTLLLSENNANLMPYSCSNFVFLMLTKHYENLFKSNDLNKILMNFLNTKHKGIIQQLVTLFYLFLNREHIHLLFSADISIDTLGDIVNYLMDHCSHLFEKEDVKHLLQGDKQYFPYRLAESRDDLFDENDQLQLMHNGDVKTLTTLARKRPELFKEEHIDWMEKDVSSCSPIFAQLLQNQSPLITKTFQGSSNFRLDKRLGFWPPEPRFAVNSAPNPITNTIEPKRHRCIIL